MTAARFRSGDVTIPPARSPSSCIQEAGLCLMISHSFSPSTSSDSHRDSCKGTGGEICSLCSSQPACESMSMEREDHQPSTATASPPEYQEGGSPREYREAQYQHRESDTMGWEGSSSSTRANGQYQRITGQYQRSPGGWEGSSSSSSSSMRGNKKREASMHGEQEMSSASHHLSSSYSPGLLPPTAIRSFFLALLFFISCCSNLPAVFAATGRWYCNSYPYNDTLGCPLCVANSPCQVRGEGLGAKKLYDR